MASGPQRSQPITYSVLLFLVWLLLAARASAAPSIALSKKFGPPTSKILVSGDGFEPNVGVDVFFDTKDKAQVVTNGKGEFHDARILVPRSARPGQHLVKAVERSDRRSGQGRFLVETNWSEFHFQANGTRLNPYEIVLNVGNVRQLGLKWTEGIQGNSINSSPAVVNGVVYIGAGNEGIGYVYALDARTGNEVWRFATGDWVASSPAVADGMVYVGSDDYNVYALNACDGRLLWSYPTGYWVVAAPAVAKGVVYVGSYDDNFYALDARSGSKLWSHKMGNDVDGYVSASAVVVSGVVYIDSEGGTLYALDARTGEVLWNFNVGVGNSQSSSPAVVDGAVYVGSADSKVYALSAGNGTLLWTYATQGYISSSPAVMNGVVYIGSNDGSLYALDAKTGAELWTFTTSGAIDTSPAAANGVVYVTSEAGSLSALNAHDGTKLWSFSSSNFGSSPVVANGRVYVGGGYLNPNVYAFSLKQNR